MVLSIDDSRDKYGEKVAGNRCKRGNYVRPLGKTHTITSASDNRRSMAAGSSPSRAWPPLTAEVPSASILADPARWLRTQRLRRRLATVESPRDRHPRQPVSQLETRGDTGRVKNCNSRHNTRLNAPHHRIRQIDCVSDRRIQDIEIHCPSGAASLKSQRKVDTSNHIPNSTSAERISTVGLSTDSGASRCSHA